MAKKINKSTSGGNFSGTAGFYPEAVPSLDLHALTVVEALPRVDIFLHDSYRAGYFRVRIVHGKGTGVLKLEVGRYLATHPLVLRCQSADTYHGGPGATEVYLTDR